MSILCNKRLEKMIELQYTHTEAVQIIEFFKQKSLDKLVDNLIDLEITAAEDSEDRHD